MLQRSAWSRRKIAKSQRPKKYRLWDMEGTRGEDPCALEGGNFGEKSVWSNQNSRIPK
jgi:hypothetical protein